MKKGIIVVTGQTATGKTNLALTLAKKHNGELINADSRQIYRYLDIVTGKDLEEINSQHVPIHLVSVVTPDVLFSSYDFAQRATHTIHDILKRGKMPIIVGGTYLYIKHLLYGFATQGIKPNEALREKLKKTSVEELQKILANNSAFDRNGMNESDWHNPRRLIRKIEIVNTPNSNLPTQRDNFLPRYDLIQFIGLKHSSRQHLEAAIRLRVEERLAQGAIDETKNVLTLGYKSTDPGLLSIGYKQIIDFLDNNNSEEAAMNEWIIKEIQYAKRQYTFMKKDPNILWSQVGSE